VVLQSYFLIFNSFQIIAYNFAIVYTGSLPNSRRKIEPELMRFMMQSSQIERKFNMLPSNCQGIFQILDLENYQADDENKSFESEELQAFLNISKELVSGGATGSESYPGELLPPMNANVILPDSILDLLIDYYNRAYVEYNFSRPRLDFSSSSENYIAVTGKVTQYGRLRIEAEYFGSVLSKRYTKSSYILARFIDERNNDIDTYPGQVQFYFEHTTHLPSIGPVKHYLAFVNWYRPAVSADARFLFANEDSDDYTNDPELWKREFFNTSADSIIPVHHILGRFVPAKFKYKRTEYLAVLPLNRRFHF
jgi:hypothetical protein